MHLINVLPRHLLVDSTMTDVALEELFSSA
jgi:hypothetical protein